MNVANARDMGNFIPVMALPAIGSGLHMEPHIIQVVSLLQKVRSEKSVELQLCPHDRRFEEDPRGTGTLDIWSHEQWSVHTAVASRLPLPE